MSLGLNLDDGGDFMPRIQYNAKSGRLARIDRAQDAAGNFQNTEVDLTNQNPTFMIDMAGIEVGWIKFPKGGGIAPEFVMAMYGQPIPPRPSNEFKQGFRLRAYSDQFLGGTREWSGNAKSVVRVIDGLHTQFQSSPEAGAGRS